MLEPVWTPHRGIADYPKLGALFRLSRSELIDANEALFTEGDSCDSIFMVEQGCMRLQRILGDGRRAIVAFLFEDSVLSSFDKNCRFTAETVTPVKIRRVARAALVKHIAVIPELRDELYGVGCHHLVNSMEHNVILSRLSAHGRVAAFLIWFAEQIRPGTSASQELDLPMNRLDIADFLGLTIESVSRAMTKLKADEVIAIPNIHQVVLRDVEALRILAGVDGH
jgi:CRP/FNR family transcriptional regulator